ncbi:type VI secretion system lipoprotein TssJ [Serratia microhaemolytica]|uniref:type VI secretion system lipoprotein TssJ n=1 Tax=Serratia microhaemolytica TaxID=2675110 RepID=UPI0013923F9B|nr:type VI secretion system lipoprotein TssJ [Serratia microhaemolytica]
MLFNIVSPARIMLPTLLLLLTGCRSPTGEVSREIADPVPSYSLFRKQVKLLHLDFFARHALNSENATTGLSPESVLVRVYQLRDNKQFQKATYRQLAEQGNQALQKDLLESHSLIIRPGSAIALTAPLAAEARYIAVIALFRQPNLDKNDWRLLLARRELDADRARAIELRDNYLRLKKNNN